jgi:two-component system cell cycle sensor histidine kinase/response regulator CckA
VSTLRGSETILLVEDEEALRVIARQILIRNGYRVLEAKCGTDALEVAQQHGDAIDLLLTDVVMPNMGGRELADQPQSLRPQLRVLYMSGYTDDAITHHRVLDPGVQLLQKPVTPSELLERIRSILDAR